MKFVFLSPHFPPNFYHFAVRLKQHGVTVLGLADENYDSLRPELKGALTEYYRVNDMHNYDELVRALGYFTNHYGKLDRLDSHNEYWLETEAGLRTDFNIFGLRLDDIQRVKRKSVMKEVFVNAGVKVARGRVIGNLNDALDLVAETGYPLVAKPDVGVGAAATYKIHDQAELERFFVEKPPFDYLLEEYILGDIETFDGLTDFDGNLVFVNSLAYSAGIMETVLADDHVYYYTRREIPADLEEVGRRVLREFGVRERFFHFEFFRRPETGELWALEVNMRPPGGMSLDMFNYSCDIDIYDAWASLV
ncbi:MAG TPA: hypothetical protein VFQ23_17125, partial [Anaerolineales bacterium]|nr:hypothetical protein [Anaerolineales bacterium]